MLSSPDKHSSGLSLTYAHACPVRQAPFAQLTCCAYAWSQPCWPKQCQHRNGTCQHKTLHGPGTTQRRNKSGDLPEWPGGRTAFSRRRWLL